MVDPSAWSMVEGSRSQLRDGQVQRTMAVNIPTIVDSSEIYHMKAWTLLMSVISIHSKPVSVSKVLALCSSMLIIHASGLVAVGCGWLLFSVVGFTSQQLEPIDQRALTKTPW